MRLSQLDEADGNETLKLDITIDSNNVNDVSDSYPVQCAQVIRRATHELPCLRPLVLQLKKLLSEAHLNKPFFGIQGFRFL